jgi:flavodoxin
MKRLLFTGVMIVSFLFAGCSAESENSASSHANEIADETPETEEKQGDRTLVAYFSGTGTTAGIAERIAEFSHSDIYVITPEVPYTEEDLDYTNPESRAVREAEDDSSRPALGGEPFSLEGSDTLYLGYPIWGGDAAAVLHTFVETYDFTGVTVIPFCTSGGSPVGDSAEVLEKEAGSGNWKEGTRLAGNISDSDLKAWMEEMK